MADKNYPIVIYFLCFLYLNISIVAAYSIAAILHGELKPDQKPITITKKNIHYDRTADDGSLPECTIENFACSTTVPEGNLIATFEDVHTKEGCKQRCVEENNCSW